MTVKTTVEQRRIMYQRHLRGESYVEIAASYGLSRSCVRHWRRRQRDGGSTQTKWRRPAPGPLSKTSPAVVAGVRELRQAHPRWGPGMIRLHLGKQAQLQDERLPSVSSIGRYLRRHFPRQRTPRPAPVPCPRRPTQVHECWQVDFKEGIIVEEETQVSLHTVQDPVGAACITAQVTSAGKAGQRGMRVGIAALQATLRSGFSRWGTRPQYVQTDGEPVFVGSSSTDSFPSTRGSKYAYGCLIEYYRVFWRF